MTAGRADRTLHAVHAPARHRPHALTGASDDVETQDRGLV